MPGLVRRNLVTVLTLIVSVLVADLTWAAATIWIDGLPRMPYQLHTPIVVVLSTSAAAAGGAIGARHAMRVIVCRLSAELHRAQVGEDLVHAAIHDRIDVTAASARSDLDASMHWMLRRLDGRD